MRNLGPGKVGIASALLLCNLSQLAARERQRTETTWKVASGTYAVSIALDWQSTHAMLQHPGLYERNPVLGRHPSSLKVGLWMVGAGTGIYLLLNRLRQSGHPRLAKAVLMGMTALELGLARHNDEIAGD